MNHHDGTSAVVAGQLNNLSRQGLIWHRRQHCPATVNTKKEGIWVQGKKKYLSNFLLCIITEAFPATPVPPACIPPAVQQVVTMLAPAYKPPLCAIFHGDLLSFPVILAILSAIVPPHIAAASAPACGHSERAPCHERSFTEKYEHPLQQVHPSLLPQPTLHHEGTLIKRGPFLRRLKKIKSRFIFVCFFPFPASII